MRPPKPPPRRALSMFAAAIEFPSLLRRGRSARLSGRHPHTPEVAGTAELAMFAAEGAGCAGFGSFFALWLNPGARDADAALLQRARSRGR
jgi:hypothetical protein